MLLYKCEECGLLISEDLKICPKCKSVRNMLSVNTDEIEEVVYKLTMDDVDIVINEMDDDDVDKINEYSRSTIQDVVSRKLEIPHQEYIEAVLNSRLIQ